MLCNNPFVCRHQQHLTMSPTTGLVALTWFNSKQWSMMIAIALATTKLLDLGNTTTTEGRQGSSQLEGLGGPWRNNPAWAKLAFGTTTPPLAPPLVRVSGFGFFGSGFGFFGLSCRFGSCFRVWHLACATAWDNLLPHEREASL